MTLSSTSKHILAASAGIMLLFAPATQAQDMAPVSLEREVRESSQTALQNTLLELLALRQAAHQAHWNVVGSDFYQLHEFYEELYSSLDGPIDKLGARLRSLGFAVEARPSAVAGAIEFRNPSEAQGEATLSALNAAYAAISRKLYDRIDATSEDMPTQDLLIGIAAMIDMDLWMIRAHLEGR